MALFEGGVSYIANALGIAPDAVRLLLGLIFSQMFAILHCQVLSRITDITTKRVSHLLIGLFVGYFVWGTDCLHHAASALGFYLMFLILPWGLAVKLNFVYQLGYLIVGYYYNNMVTTYAINWTTTQAIITLKMIGIGFDLNDTKKEGAKLPSILAVLGYTFFLGTYIVGPLDNFGRFEAFIGGSLFAKEKEPRNVIEGIKRMCHGVFYLALSQITTSIFTSEFIFTSKFLDLPFPLRVLYITGWGHCCLYKYLGAWCIAESTCMYMGYTYNGEGKWDGLRNVATSAFHQSTRLQDVIDSWNINTSEWCGKYIYKRCRFLGNKSLSQLITMIFLATWHGLHFGYFLCFFQEFFYMFMEKGLARNSILQSMISVIPSPVGKIIGWLYAKIFLSFALVGFELYHFHTILYVYKSLYFFCPIVAVILISSNVIFVQKSSPEKTE